LDPDLLISAYVGREKKRSGPTRPGYSPNLGGKKEVILHKKSFDCLGRPLQKSVLTMGEEGGKPQEKHNERNIPKQKGRSDPRRFFINEKGGRLLKS